MDEFNFFQFLNDDNEILQAEDQHSRDFPTFRVHFGEYFDDFSTPTVRLTHRIDLTLTFGEKAVTKSQMKCC